MAHARAKRSASKWGPFRLKRKWNGRRVRTLERLETRGGDAYPKGAIATVDASSAGTFSLWFGPCSRCGHEGSVRVDAASWRRTFELAE